MIRSTFSRSLSSLRRAYSDVRFSPELMDGLKKVDTAAICDADKKLRLTNEDEAYRFFLLKDLKRIPTSKTSIMAGIARTVELVEPNDFLGVIQGILEAEEGEVLVVDARHSHLAIAGELLAAEADQKKLEGLIIIDGCMRDTAGLLELSNLACYANGVTPYAGTCLHPATMQCNLHKDKIEIRPGDIVVGDEDGIVVGSVNTFTKILPVAQEILATESVVRTKQRDFGVPLASLCNVREHLENRLRGEESQFKFQI